jgi:Fur family ferric uptake transcriptional regulator
MKPQSDLKARMIEALRAAGVRVTSQRVALLGLLADARDHPDAAELHRRAQAADGAISLATVYRTLAVLKRAGVVQRHSFDGDSARFERAEEPHHDHIVDLDTGRIVEFQSDKIERLQQEIAAELGFQVVHHRLELYCRRIKAFDSG